MKNKETTSLGILFPGEEVELEPGRKARVRPLSLEDIPDILGAFSNIMGNREGLSKMTPIEIGSAMSRSIIKLIPYCVREPHSDDEIPAKDIPLLKVPQIVELIRSQNFPPESVGKWKALFLEVAGHLTEQSGKKQPSEK